MRDVVLKNPFLKMIRNLFLTNRLVLFGRINNISEEQEQEVLDYIKSHYIKESSDYPGPLPEFNQQAALWSSKILFYAAQLVMYREHKASSLTSFFPNFTHPQSTSAIITSDLCLRYLPSILKYLEQIDVEDELIPIIKKILAEWHYSGLLSDVNFEPQKLEAIIGDELLCRLYIDRIIETKNKQLGQNKKLMPLVLSAMGNYTNEFWKDFKITI